MRRVIACCIGVWLSVCGAVEPEQVLRVRRGELAEAKASWWGYDKEDATRFLQAAIDSQVPRLIVDRTGTPWVTEGLRCVSGQEIVFEKGVEVVARKGMFMGKNDSLFLLSCVSNVTLYGPGATLRMRRSDYDAPPYAKAEWRHVLDIKSSVNVRVIGLTLAESGGDGIYLGCARGGQANRDIHIKDVVCDRNYRQGISVISAENLLIENTVMRDTAGTPPEAGIDFEPNHMTERLKNCVMRGCLTVNNKGSGYDFYLPNLKRASEPVSLRMENCRSEGDKYGVKITTGNGEADAVGGSMCFEGCSVERSERSGVSVSRKPVAGIALEFAACSILQCAGTNATPDILLMNRVEDEWPVGGLRLDRVRIVQPAPRPWLVWQNNTTVAEPLTAVSGTVTVADGRVERRVELTPDWVKATFPPRFPVRVPRVIGELGQARVTDQVQGTQKLSPLRVRRTARYIFHAAGGREVILAGAQVKVGRYEVGKKPLTVTAPSGKRIATVPAPLFGERAEVRFSAPEPGFYALEVDVGANAFVLQEANVPVALDATKRAAAFFNSAGELFVPVPTGTKVFAFSIAGEGAAESVQAAVIDPAGQTVWSKARITEMERFTASEGQGEPRGVWRIRLDKPEGGGFEDFHVDVSGVPGYLFLRGDRYWSFP